MLDLERVDVAGIRAQLERGVRDIPAMVDRPRAKQALVVIATSIAPVSPMAKAANDVTLPGQQRPIVSGQVVQYQSVTREESDQQFEAVLNQCREALNHIEDYQRRVKETDQLSWDETRGMVLARINEVSLQNGGELISSSDIQVALGLSFVRVKDAIDYLRDASAITCSKPIGWGSRIQMWNVGITHVGRDLARGKRNDAGIAFVPQSVTNVHNYAPVGTQQIGDSNVVNTAQTTFNVSVVTNAMQVVRDNLDALPAEEREDVENHLAALDVEVGSPEPNRSRIKSTLKAIEHTVAGLASTAAKSAIEAAVNGAVKGMMGA